MGQQTNILMLKLWHDEFRSEQLPPRYFIETAGILESEVNRSDVREWIEASPMSPSNYTRLRHLLLILRRSTACEPRRLTWLERITGRLQQ